MLKGVSDMDVKMFTSVFTSVFTSFIIFKLIQRVRYGTMGFGWDFRSLFVLYPIAKLSGQPQVVFINDECDMELCKLVLKTSNVKGKGIENWFALPAWYPIYNIESVDYEIWKKTKHFFHIIASSIKNNEVEQVSIMIMNTLLKTTHTFDSKTLSLIPARIYYRILFGVDLPERDVELFYNAMMEWKKHVALKGFGDLKLKTKLIDTIRTAIIESQRYSENVIEGVYRNDPELMTAFVQPFFISPMINFGDIFVAVFKYITNDDIIHCQASPYQKCFVDLEAIILESIRLQHPFPILERESTVEIKYKGTTYPIGTQFFIEFDKFKQVQDFKPQRWLNSKTENKYSFMPFGLGPRQCLGKHIAIKTLVPVLFKLLNHPNCSIKPWQGHLYSGRSNDHSTSIRETLYILSKLFGTYCKLLVLNKCLE